MADVLIFKSRTAFDYETNLADFIEFGRQLAPLNDQYDYDSHYWGKVGNFTVFGANSRQRNPDELLDDSFLPFAKAYIVYGGGSKAAINVKFQALRAINNSFVKQYGKGKVDITKLCVRDLDKAVEVIRESLGGGAGYQAGRGLVNLCQFLQNNNLVSPFQWKSPIKKPADNPTGHEADKRRQEKMPDDNALMALASISAHKTEELSSRDIFTTATMAILLAAPNRGSEPFYLLHNCMHEDKVPARKALELGLSEEEVKELLSTKKKMEQEDTDALTFDGLTGNILGSPKTKDDDAKVTELGWEENIIVKGLKWYSGKEFGHAHKWIPSVMYSVIETAVERLLKQSEGARHFARMLEESPDFPRHKLCPNVPEDQLLTMDEVALALGLDLSIYGHTKQKNASRARFLRRKEIALEDYRVCLNDLNKIVRNALPEGFPYIPFKNGNGHVKVKWSESLYAGFANALGTQKPTIYTELSIPTINTLNEDLAPTKKKSRTTGRELTGSFSIFQRWGYGKLAITSHQLRHMLDTMAAVNGMDGEMRARWAMRSDPTHNRYYDHTTHEEYGADFIEDREREIRSQEYAIKPKQQNTQIQVQVATPRTLQELNTKASLTAHTTEYGMCIISYLSESCTKYRDCINCNEHVCEKGDGDKCERIRERLKNEKRLLKMDNHAVDNGVQGALQWYERRKLTTERCEQLVTMLEDPSIEDGTLIKLINVEDVSLLDRAMDANGKKRLPKIQNFQRIKARTTVTVKELIGSKAEAMVTMDNQITDDDFFSDLDALDNMGMFED